VHIIGIFCYILLFIPLCCFVFGVCLILSSLNVYFTDIEKIWSFFVKILWLATPIFYSIEGQTRLFYLNLFNPTYYFITIFRDIIIYNKALDFSYFFTAISYSLLFLLFGLLIFNKLKVKFAEMI
jgi:ABC-type polysaccharide/polyol phosphate export permease